MILTYEQIRSMANGIVRTEENELGLELHRFTRTQEGYFYQSHPLYCRESFFKGYFGRNCSSCSGVTLDFISDAKEILMEFGGIDKGNHGDESQLIDLYEDNCLAKSFRLDKCNISHLSDGKLKRFTVYFPFFALPIIFKIELRGASEFKPLKKPIDILFYGDSITHGAWADHPSHTYPTQIARKLDVGILNQGNSGFVYDENTIEKVCDPKVIVNAYGINDYGRKTPEQLEEQTEAFFKRLRELYSNAKIVSILPLWTVMDKEDPNFGKAQRACLKKVYEQYSDRIVDGFTLVPKDLEFFCDGLHPNEKGFTLYAENLLKVLEPLLES